MPGGRMHPALLFAPHVNNNPIRYNDPTGHNEDCGIGEVCRVGHDNPNDHPKPFTNGGERFHKFDGGWNDPEHSAWYSGNYGGCTLCHYAHAQGKSILTNSELVTADQNFREWMAVGETPMVVTTVLVGGTAIAPEVTYLAGVTCLRTPVCVTVTGAAGGAGTPTHGNSLDSPRKTYLYQLLDKNGDHLKYGITSQANPENRYTRQFLLDKTMNILAEGSRRAMHLLENELILNNPRGPLQLNNH